MPEPGVLIGGAEQPVAARLDGQRCRVERHGTSSNPREQLVQCGFRGRDLGGIGVLRATQGLGCEQQSQLRRGLERGDSLRRQLTRHGDLALCFLLIALHYGDRSQADGDEERHRDRGEHDPAEAGRGLPAGHDVFGVQRRRLRLLVARASQPRLRLGELGSAEREAAAASAGPPFGGALQKPAVPADPGWIDANRRLEPVQAAREIVGLAHEEPLLRGRCRWNARGVHVPSEQGKDPLAMQRGMLQLAEAVPATRSNRGSARTRSRPRLRSPRECEAETLRRRAAPPGRPRPSGRGRRASARARRQRHGRCANRR